MAQAASHYRDALPDLAPAYRDEALARLRLAEALMGHDEGQPVTAPVNLGEVKMEAAEFERLVDQPARGPGEASRHGRHRPRRRRLAAFAVPPRPL